MSVDHISNVSDSVQYRESCLFNQELRGKLFWEFPSIQIAMEVQLPVFFFLAGVRRHLGNGDGVCMGVCVRVTLVCKCSNFRGITGEHFIFSMQVPIRQSWFGVVFVIGQKSFEVSQSCRNFKLVVLLAVGKKRICSVYHECQRSSEVNSERKYELFVNMLSQGRQPIEQLYLACGFPEFSSANSILCGGGQMLFSGFL